MRLPVGYWVWCLTVAGSAQQPGFLLVMTVNQPRSRRWLHHASWRKGQRIDCDGCGHCDEANLQWLQERNYRYLVFGRTQAPSGMGRGIIANCVRVQGTNEVRIYSKPSDDERSGTVLSLSSRARKSRWIPVSATL
ncbi:MAG: hypothetical protein IPP22_14640 [Nitrosomonas sp.]|nr:hypothetical protein [Nitrosomonas sp.]